jgi:hypothetical protein
MRGRVLQRRMAGHARGLRPAWLVAVCITLAGYALVQYLQPRWSVPSADASMDRLAWFVGSIQGVWWHAHHTLHSALPSEQYVTILELAACTVLAAVLLRGPRS